MLNFEICCVRRHFINGVKHCLQTILNYFGLLVILHFYEARAAVYHINVFLNENIMKIVWKTSILARRLS